MDQDLLLQSLARHAREEAVAEGGPYANPRWQALAAGTLAAAQAEAFRAEMESLLGADAAAEAFAAYQPLDETFQQRVVERLLADREAEPVGRTGARGERITPASRIPAPRPVRDSRRPRRWLGWAAVAAALATVAVTALLWRDAPATNPAPLPAYRATLRGGVDSWRGLQNRPDGPRRTTLVAGNEFDLVLRPATAVDGELAARAFLRREVAEGESTVERWPVAIEVADTGVVSIRGIVGVRSSGEGAGADTVRLPLPPGASTLLVLVAPSGSLPADETLAGELARRPPPEDPAATGEAACTALAPERTLCQVRLDVREQL